MADRVVTADMAGAVFSVDVAVGDAVVADQSLLVLESMKMHIPVEAPAAGTSPRAIPWPRARRWCGFPDYFRFWMIVDWVSDDFFIRFDSISSALARRSITVCSLS